MVCADTVEETPRLYFCLHNKKLEQYCELKEFYFLIILKRIQKYTVISGWQMLLTAVMKIPIKKPQSKFK